MQSRPENWAAFFAAPHAVEYRYLINGVEYREKDIQGTPLVDKPLMQEPCIGRCCTATLTITIRQHANETIPKAASVEAYCRLKSRKTSEVTDWVPQGKYWISRRSASGELVTLTCRDAMLYAGLTYVDKSQFTEWPVSMTDVFNEIVSLMGVTADPRTVIKTGDFYMVSYPSEDVLMSEVLAMIAAAHGGLFIMSEAGQLRLVPYPAIGTPVQDVNSSYTYYKPLSTGKKTVSRITLTDSADNQFTYGNDSGIELATTCEYATQEMTERIGAGYSISASGVLFVLSDELNAGAVSLRDDTTAENGILTLDTQAGLIGRDFMPYELTGAYLDPLVELGDTISIKRKGSAISLIAASISIRLSSAFVCDLSHGVEDDDEDEVPYISASELQAKRYVSTTKSYYGNRINRKDGFVSEYMVDGAAVARLIANASTFSMQRYSNNTWQDCIYFDAVERKYRLTGDVTVEGAITSEDLSTSGKTVINGDNITTGTLNANLVKISGTKDFYWNNDNIYLIDPDNDKQQIRIGAFDGKNLGIGFTKDGGKSWSTAMDFDGLHVSLTDQYSGVTLTNSSIAFPAASNGAVTGEKTFTSECLAYTGKTAVAPVISNISGIPDGMTVTVGELTDKKRIPLTITIADGATLGSEESTDGVIEIAVTSPVEMTLQLSWCKVNTGAKGIDGTSGYNQAVIMLYQRAETTPTLPTAATTYTFATGELAGDIGEWSLTMPEGENPCYTTTAEVISRASSVSVPASSWTSVIKLVENGESGYNSAVAYLYKRAAETPTTPAESVLYTFATAAITGTLDGWSQSAPTSDGNPCWLIQAQVVARTATVTITTSDWTAPVKLVEDGLDGAKTYYQDTAPTNARAQDLWIDSSDDCKLYRYNGTEWQSIQDMNIPQIVEQLVSVNTTFETLQGSIESKVDKTTVSNQFSSFSTTISSAIEQTADDLTVTFGNTVRAATGAVDTKYSALIRASGDGVEIGKSNSNFRTLLTNERLSFLQGKGETAVEVAYISNKKLYITDAQVTHSLTIGAQDGNTFVWSKTSSGLSLCYVSAEA